MSKNQVLSSIFLAYFLLLAGIVFGSPYGTFNYKIFHVPERGPVVETYFDISGRSISLMAGADSMYYGKVEITMIFKQGEEIITYDKKLLESPRMTAQNRIDFLDVHRFALAPGVYDLEIKLKDALDSLDQGEIAIVPVSVNPLPEGVSISDIELISAYKKTEVYNAYSKSGYDLLPMVDDDYLKAEMSEVAFYAEIYGATEALMGPKYLVKCFLEDTATSEIIEATIRNLRQTAGTVTPLLVKLPLQDVPSGSYRLVIEARDQNNEMLAKKEMVLHRTNPGEEINTDLISDTDLESSWVMQYDDKDVLFNYLKSLRPVAQQAEQIAIDNTFDDDNKLVELKYIQRYFYAFWKKRYPTNAEAEWLRYKKQVDWVEKNYATPNKHGYDTDQGRVYLQYGAPDDVSVRANEPSSYPYEIWRYYKAGKYNNVKFVFYDPNLLAQDYVILHCEYIPGEIQNYQWKLLLQQRDTPILDVDRTNNKDAYGRRVDDYFENPR